MIHAENISGFVGNQLWLNLHWILPEGWSLDCGANTALFLNQYHCGEGHAWAEAVLTVGPVTAPITTVLLEVTAHDRPVKVYIPVEFVCE